MDGILRAFGFESKPEFADKIPDTLTPDSFNVHNTFRHGFSSQPISLGYDSVQQLLSVGTEHGAVLLIGKPGLERHILHPTTSAVVQIQFITNKGLLVTCCENNTLYLWDLREKLPSIVHTLKFTSEKPTCLSYVYGSDWLYVGTDAGNVHLIHVQTFKLSGFVIHWNNAIELSCRTRPGDVISIHEHPLDQGKILIAFSCGKCVLFDLKAYSEQHHHLGSKISGGQKDVRVDPHKRFDYDPGSDHILTSVSWLGNGKSFACSYSDGSVVIWNPKSETKPEKVHDIHEADSSAFKPIYKLQLVHTDSDPWTFCSGGYPEGNDMAPRTLTVLRGKNPPRVLSSESTILDFLCLPSSPYASDCQKPFALAILTKNELIIHDLEQPNYPRYPNYLFPYALDIHIPPVTFLHYCANCPDEFIASLHSVKSKLMYTSAKPWPLKGGKWGQEVPNASTDLILTGHVDGSVRLWYCTSVILQSFFTLNTSRYFKMQYQPSETNSSSASITNKPPSPTKATESSSVKKTPPSRPSPPLHTKNTSDSASLTKAPSQKMPFVPSKSLPEIVMMEKMKVTDDDQKGSEVSPTKATPSPTTGQQEVYPANATDGGVLPSEVARKLIQSHKRKSMFKKKKAKSTECSPIRSRSTTPISDENGSPTKDLTTPTKGQHLQVSSAKEKKSFPKLSAHSFRKVARAVGFTRSLSKDKSSGNSNKKDLDSIDEPDGKDPPVAPTEVEDDSNCSESDVSDRRKKPRPENITIPSESQAVSEARNEDAPPTNTPMVQGPPRCCNSGSPNSDDFVILNVTTAQPDVALVSKTSQHASKPRVKTIKLANLVKVPEVESNTVDIPLAFTVQNPFSAPFVDCRSDDFFPVTNIRMCVFGLWLCVSNNGGAVLAFDFQLKVQKKPPQAIEIDFDSDSITKQYASNSSVFITKKSHGSAPTYPPTSPVGQWVFDDKLQDSLPGFQLTQLCSCYRYSQNEGKNDLKRIPITVSTLQYSVDIGLLAIGSSRGFALVDIEANACLYVLSSLTSILYLADPNKFNSQMRRETQNVMPMKKALVKRHSTFHALRAVTTVSVPTKPKEKPHRAKSHTGIAAVFVPSDDVLEDDCFDDKEMTVSELECSVTSLELVQLQLDKQSPPTLTLWVGLASGYVVSYGVNVIKHDQRRRIELIPTKFITEIKAPVVSVFFLNDWGERQVIPYQLKRTNLAKTPDHHAAHKTFDKARGKQMPHTLEHYAIIVSEDKLRSFGFPGLTKVAVCSPPLVEGSAILQSEYFTCNDLPCVLSVTSDKTLFVHSLPGLKQLMNIPFGSLTNTLSVCTFHVSGRGQAIFMRSASELQRLSVVNEDNLNIPGCLPDLFIKMPDPEPYQGGVGKRILEALFAPTLSTVDREALFGAAARRPIGDVYKLDGKSGSAYVGQRDKDKEERLKAGGKERSGPPPHKETSTALAGQLNKNVHALHERKEKLTAIEQRTAEVAQQASDFASLATRLRQKYES